MFEGVLALDSRPERERSDCARASTGSGVLPSAFANIASIFVHTIFVTPASAEVLAVCDPTGCKACFGGGDIGGGITVDTVGNPEDGT